MRRNERRKMQIMAIAIFCTCLMAVGYALVRQELKFSGNVDVTGTWNIKMINVEPVLVGDATNKSDPIINDTSVTFNLNFNAPGDEAMYIVTAKNNGTIDAIVESINITGHSHDNLIITHDGIEKGSVLEATREVKFYIRIEYDRNVTNPTPFSETITLTINYVQKTGSGVTINNNIPASGILPRELASMIAVSSGDGLYNDSAEPGRYIFKGADPLNKITFNGENWRILSIEADGTMKIIKETSIGNIKWDTENTRNSTNDTYCTNPGNGCNAWAKTTNLLDANGNVPTEFKLYYPNGNISNDTTSYAGSVTSADASLNTYLNSNYFTNTLQTDKQYIVEHKFNVGTPGNSNDTESVAVDVEQEKNYQWIGKVGLITATEYMRTTTNATCTSLNVGYGSSNSSNCGTNNWVKPNSGYMWTLSPFAVSGRSNVWSVYSGGDLYIYNATYSSSGVWPVVYLDSNILLSGEGSTSKRYQIVGRK